MKRIVSTIVFAGLVLGSVDAFASRARENVMGRGDAGSMLNSSGSMYYDSMYNIFYNPAYVNDFKNWAIIEKGADNGAGSTVHNEGGFATSVSNVNVAVFFNRTDAFGSPVSFGGENAGSPIDIVVGGDMGVKWGLGITHLSNGQENATALRAGVTVGDFDPYLNYRMKGNDDDMTVGLRYHYGEWTPYAAYRMGEAANNAGKFNSMLVGVGRNVKLGEGARLVYGLAYANVSTSDSAVESERTLIPVSMALEGDLASWFTIRGGLTHNIRGKNEGSEVTMSDVTTARLGATIHANKFDFDWAVGNGGIDANTVGWNEDFFTNASLSYKW